VFSWDGWSDSLSGIREYVIEVFHLKPNKNVKPNLTEPGPWTPYKRIKLAYSDRTFIYTPDQPGMYSFILNIFDKANNSQYARNLVLFDDHSSVTKDNFSPIIATSAAKETNFKWQNSLSNDITISWKGHFRNRFHDENKLLIPVTPYAYYNSEFEFEKKVPVQLEDMDGKRTLSGITNANGITQFQFAYRNANQGRNTTSLHWHNVSNVTSQTVTLTTPRQSGDTLNVWIKAKDIIGNEQVDMTQIHFDDTPPELENRSIILEENLKNSTYPFSSRLV
jgi:hypothetical protein